MNLLTLNLLRHSPLTTSSRMFETEKTKEEYNSLAESIPDGLRGTLEVFLLMMVKYMLTSEATLLQNPQGESACLEVPRAMAQRSPKAWILMIRNC